MRRRNGRNILEYNRQDVVVEKAIRKRLLSLKPPAIEHEYWLLDQDINWRRRKVDMELVDAALACNDEIVEGSYRVIQDINRIRKSEQYYAT